MPDADLYRRLPKESRDMNIEPVYRRTEESIFVLSRHAPPFGALCLHKAGRGTTKDENRASLPLNRGFYFRTKVEKEGKKDGVQGH
jgi:hypothetical protein